MSWILALALFSSPLEPPVSPREATLGEVNYRPKYPYYVFTYPDFLNNMNDMGVDDPALLHVLVELSQRARICEWNAACLAIYPISNEGWAVLTRILGELGRSHEVTRVLLEPETALVFWL